MEQPELSLDHVALLVRRLNDAADAFRRMGFTLSHRSLHEGQLEPGGQRLAWGTAGHSVTFAQGYLELVAAAGDTEYGQAVTARAREREGIHLLALATGDLARLKTSLAGRVSGIEDPRFLVREWPIGDETRPVAFKMAQLDNRFWPEADLALVEHRSADLIWRSDLPDHDNGARALAFVVLATREPAKSRERFARLLGPSTGSLFQLRRGRLTVTDLVSITRRYPGADIAPPPFPAALGVEVDDLARVGALLRRNQVPYQQTPNETLWVAPAHAGGCIVEFVVERAEVQAPNRWTFGQRAGRAIDRTELRRGAAG